MHSFGKPNPRTEYRRGRAAQIDNSPSLAARFPKLKILRVVTDYFDSSGEARTGGMKYKVNPAHGKSLFCFNCMNVDCIGGDYDLTDPLAQAVARKQTVAEGELRCQGTRHSKERKPHDRPCQSILRYKLTLGY
jgi:hypothetical protein